MRNEAVPIVAQSQEEALDGIKKLAAEVAVQYQKEREYQKKAYLHGCEIGRLICTFAETPAVQARLAVINKDKNGSPQKAHCFVAKELFNTGTIGVTLRHLETCARSYLNARELGLPASTPLREVEALMKLAKKPIDEVMPSPEALFVSEKTTAEQDAEFDLEKEVEKIAKVMTRVFYTAGGHSRLLPKKEGDKAAKLLSEKLEELGIGWELVPVERK